MAFSYWQTGNFGSSFRAPANQGAQGTQRDNGRQGYGYQNYAPYSYGRDEWNKWTFSGSCLRATTIAASAVALNTTTGTRKSADVAVSGGDLTATGTRNADDAVSANAKTTVSKFIFEATVDFGAGCITRLGIDDGSFDMSAGTCPGVYGEGVAVSFAAGNSPEFAMDTVYGGFFGAAVSGPLVVTFTVDTTTGSNNVNIYYTISGTTTLIKTYSWTPSTGEWWTWVSGRDNGAGAATAIMNFAGPFTAPQAGYSAYDPGVVAGTTDGALSATAVASTSLSGAEISAQAFNPSGLAAPSLAGQSVAAASLTAAGVANQALTGREIATAGLTAAGAASPSLAGSEIATASAAMSGVASPSLVGQSFATATLAASGTAATSLSGAVTATAALSGSGTANFAPTGRSVATGSLTGAETGSVSFTGIEIATGALSAAETGSLTVASGSSSFTSAVLTASGVAAFAPASVTIASGAMSASGSGTLAPASNTIKTAALSASATATAANDGARVTAGAVSASATGTFAPGPSVYATGAAIAAGFGVLVGAGRSIGEADLYAAGVGDAQFVLGALHPPVSTPPTRRVSGTDPGRTATGSLNDRTAVGNLQPRTAAA